ncbi:MAG: hypothetical protein WB439_05075 [Acidobacteriaceae bacterium]
MKRFVLLVLGAVIVAGIVFAAVPHLAAPDWTVTVVDLAGKPVRGERVREVYRDFNCDSSDHEDAKSTDELGQVHFDAQYEHRNLFECFMYTISDAQAAAHASFGRHAYVFAFGSEGEGSTVDPHGSVEDWTGSPPRMNSQITIKY